MAIRRPALLLALGFMSAALGCQAILGLDEGKDKPSTTSTASTSSSSSSSSTTSTSSSSSTSGTGGTGGAGGSTTTAGSGGTGGTGGSAAGGGGMGGATTTGSGGAGGVMTGTGGTGGATTTTTTTTTGGTGGAGGSPPTCMDGLKNGTETDLDCGGPGCPGCALGKACAQNGDCQSGDCFAGSCGAVLILAGGNAASMLGAELRPNGTFAINALNDATSFGPALAITTAGQGVALIRANVTGDLRYVTWSAGQWGSFNNVGQGVTTREQPSLVAAGTGARAVFHGDNFKHYFSAWNGSAWTIQAETVGPAASQSVGPSPPVLASSPAFPAGAEATVAFIADAVNKPYSRNRAGGAWDAASQLIDSSVTNFNLAPALVTLTSGPELMVVWMRNDNQVLYATRTSGVWSASAPIASAFTASRVALAALPSGGAILAFQGTDNFLYYAVYTAGAWGQVLPFSAPNVALAGPPAVARGIGGATAEMAFVKSADNIVYHARFMGASWTAPALIGGSNMTRVAIASAP